jgi:hypothetical protein
VLPVRLSCPRFRVLIDQNVALLFSCHHFTLFIKLSLSV